MNMGSSPPLSLAAVMGPEALGSKASGQFCSDTVTLFLKGKGDFDCTKYPYPRMKIEGQIAVFLIKTVIKYWIWKKSVLSNRME